MHLAILNKSAWDTVLDKYLGQQYQWPFAYCVPMLHDYIRYATGRISVYGNASAQFESERDMTVQLARRFGSIGASHAYAMGQSGINRTWPTGPSGTGIPDEALVAWVDGGVLAFKDGSHATIAHDLMGAILMRDRGGDWYTWTKHKGLQVVVPERTSRLWSF